MSEIISYLNELAPTAIATFTLLMAIAVFIQAHIARQQKQILKDQIEISKELAIREKDKETPKISMTAYESIFNLGRDSKELEEREYSLVSFVGFHVTNVGYTDIVMTGFWFDLGRTKSGDKAGSHASYQPDYEFHGKELSTVNFPHRLSRGESFIILFNKDGLIRKFANASDTDEYRVLPMCKDSFGNSYDPGYWVQWTDCGENIYGEPMPGCEKSNVR